MTKQYPTKQYLSEVISNREFAESVPPEIVIVMARQLLAGLEQEPVACIDRANMDYLESGAGADVWPASEADSDDVLLYAAPQLPQPAVVDEHYQHLNELYHAQEKRLFKIAQRIKGPSFDKYAYSPSQAIDVLESGIFGERECDGRSAMLQGAEPVQGWIPLPTAPQQEVK